MVPICTARGLPDGWRQELLAGAGRRRLVAALPVGPGALQQ